MNTLEAETLASVSALCNAVFRMMDVIDRTVKDRSVRNAQPPDVRHWLALRDACCYMVETIEATAQREMKDITTMQAAEVEEAMKSIARHVADEEAHVKETAEFLKRDVLPPDWNIG